MATVTLARTVAGSRVPTSMIFRQLFDRESCTYTYLLADADTREGLLIDPVVELVDRDVALVSELGLSLRYALNTHTHADHVTGTGELKRRLPGVQSVIGDKETKADVHVAHGDHLRLGAIDLEVRATPGHTEGCVSYVLLEGGSPTMAFTGDAVLTRGCGRTDFQGGSAATLYDSVWAQLFSLPDSVLLYPAHDYKGRTLTSVGEEKAHNPRLTLPKEEFIELMDKLGLAYPKKIDVALPANRACGFPGPSDPDTPAAPASS